MKVLYAGGLPKWPCYRDALESAFAALGLDAELGVDFAPAEVDYIVYAPNGPITDFAPFTRAKAVLSLWAGVERVVGNPSLKVPLTRMVDAGLKEGMVEWVAGQVLRHHLGLDPLIRKERRWEPVVPPLARDRSVGILGLGELGAACASALVGLGFQVLGWSRRPASIPGVACYSGPLGLSEVLKRAEILVLLLPRTPETENILNARTLALLPKGAVILNPGRGALIDDDALLAALDSGQIGHATLDVFRTEPLPEDHPYWTHPNVTVSPHVAAETRPETSAEVIAENIRRCEAREPLLHLVDRAAGY